LIKQKQKHPKKQTVDCWIGDLAKQKSPLSKDRKNKKVGPIHSVIGYTSKQDAPGKSFTSTGIAYPSIAVS
jgi:hypothetical protein